MTLSSCRLPESRSTDRTCRPSPDSAPRSSHVAFLLRLVGSRPWTLQPLLCADHAMTELNRQAPGDEKAKTGEAEVGDPGMPLRRVLYLQ